MNSGAKLPRPESDQRTTVSSPEFFQTAVKTAVMTTVVTTTMAPVARALTTVTAAADNGQQPVRSMSSRPDLQHADHSHAHFHTNQPSIRHRKRSTVNGSDLFSVDDDDSNGVKLESKQQTPMYNNRNFTRRYREPSKHKLPEGPTVFPLKEIPTVLPTGNWDSSVSTDRKNNTARTLSYNIELRKIPKAKFPNSPSPQASQVVTGGFTPKVGNPGSSAEKPGPSQPQVLNRSPFVKRAPTVPPEQSGPISHLVSKPKPEIRDGFDVFKAPHLRALASTSNRNGKLTESLPSTRIKPCVPNITASKAGVPNLGVPVRTEASNIGVSLKTDAFKGSLRTDASNTGDSIPKILDTNVSLDAEPPNASGPISQISNIDVSIARVSPRLNASNAGVYTPQILDANVSAVDISFKPTEVSKAYVSGSKIHDTNVSNDDVSSNVSNVNASIGNGSNVDTPTVLHPTLRLPKEKQPANGEIGHALIGWGNDYENVVAGGPVGDWDHHPLVAWDGKWGPAPVEWSIRPAFDQNDKDHLKFMDTWITQNRAQASSNPTTIDTKDPGYRTGTGLAGGESSLGKPIDTKEHDTILPNDDFTKAKRHETSAYASEMLKGRFREPGSKSRQVYKPEFPNKTAKRAYQEKLEKFDADIIEAQASYDRATNPHVPKANIYIRPVEDGDLRQVAEIYNHYVDHTVVVPEMKTLSERQWLGRWTDCTQSSYAFLVAVQLGSKVGVNNRRPSRETICGFAYADDYGERENAWRYTCELQVYVGSWTLRKGVGKALVDRMMVALDPVYPIRGGVRFHGGVDPLRYEAGGVRVVHKVVISLPYAAKDENTLKWQKEWLSQWKFEQAGNLRGIGRKFDKV